MGEPRFDLLSVHARVEAGAQFAPGAGFGYQAMIDWFSNLELEGPDDVSCGIELDCGEDETERAGVYLQYRGRHEFVEPFLQSVGEGGRAEAYRDVFSRMPDGWPPSYVGLFPGREGAPLRIGGYLTDGTVGNTFGLSLSFNETKPRRARECMEHGNGVQIMGELERWGLADDRWRLIAEVAFARHVGFTREDGTEGRFALCVLFNYAKVKFTDAIAQPAKLYLVLDAGEVA